MKFSFPVFALAALAITLSSPSVAVPMGMSQVMGRSSSLALAPRQNAASVASEFGALLEGLPFGFALVPLVDALGLNPKGNDTQSGSLLFSNLTQAQLERIEDVMAQVTKNLSTVIMPPATQKVTHTRTPRQLAGIMSMVGALLDGLPVVGPMLEPLISALGMGPSTAGSLLYESNMDEKQLQKIQEAVAEVRSTLAEYDVLIGPMNTTSTVPIGSPSVVPTNLPTSAPVNASIPPRPSASLPVTPSLAPAPPKASLDLPPTKRMAVIHQRRQLASLMSTIASLVEGLPVVGSALEPLLKALGLDPTSAASSQAAYMLDSTQVSQVQNAIAEASNSIAAIMATYIAPNPAATSTLSPASSSTPASSLVTSVTSSTIASSTSITPSSSASAPTPPPIPTHPPSSAPIPVDIDAMSPPERRQLAALMQLVNSELSSAGSLITSMPIFGPALAPIVNALGLGPTPPAQRAFFDNLTVKQLEDIHEAIMQVSQAVYSSVPPTPSGFPLATRSAPVAAPTSAVISMASTSGSAFTSTSALTSGSGSVSATGSTITSMPSSSP